MWKPIKGFENLYAISDLGEIFSLPKFGSGGHSGKILKNRLDKDGYCLVNLWKNSKRYTFKVHRLVAINFIDNPENLQQINHKDSCRTNNTIQNLEWCNAKQNSMHSWNKGRGFNPLHRRGEKSPNSKISDQQAELAKKLRRNGLKFKDISAIIGLSISQIHAICFGNSRKIICT